MAAKRRPETFDDLLNACAPGESFQDFAARAGVTDRTLLTFRKGGGVRPHRTTLAAIAGALKVEPARVRAAIEASRAAAGEK